MNNLKTAILQGNLNKIKSYENKGINFLHKIEVLKHISNSMDEYSKSYYLSEFPEAQTGYFNKTVFLYFHNKKPFKKLLLNKFLTDIIANDSLEDYLFFRENKLISLTEENIFKTIIKKQSSNLFHYLWSDISDITKKEYACELLDDAFYYHQSDNGLVIFNILFDYCDKHNLIDFDLLSKNFVNNLIEYSSSICLKLFEKGVRVNNNEKHLALRKISNFSDDNFFKFFPYLELNHEQATQLMYSSLEAYEFSRYLYIRKEYDLSLDDRISVVLRSWEINGQITLTNPDELNVIKEVVKTMPYLCTKDHIYSSYISSITMADNLEEVLMSSEMKKTKLTKKI